MEKGFKMWKASRAADEVVEVLEEGSSAGDEVVERGSLAEAGSIRNVNKVGGTKNCVNCVIATDATLAGNPASALNSDPQRLTVLEKTFKSVFTHNLNTEDIAKLVSEPGQRGIVYGNRGIGEVGHVFNVANQKGVVRYLDGQTGKAAVLEGYKNFSFLPTTK